jgi:hypothetical protein
MRKFILTTPGRLSSEFYSPFSDTKTKSQLGGLLRLVPVLYQSRGEKLEWPHQYVYIPCHHPIFLHFFSTLADYWVLQPISAMAAVTKNLAFGITASTSESSHLASISAHKMFQYATPEILSTVEYFAGAAMVFELENHQRLISDRDSFRAAVLVSKTFLNTRPPDRWTYWLEHCHVLEESCFQGDRTRFTDRA